MLDMMSGCPKDGVELQKLKEKLRMEFLLGY